MTDTPARRTRRIQAGPVRLAFRVWNAAPAPGSGVEPGRAASPPAVLLHTPGEDAADWEPVALQLTPAWRVHAPDLRGHGDSERSGPYTADQLTADLEAFLDALGLRRVALVAHSASAVPAYLFAARFPDRVTRLVLEEPVPPVPLPRAEMDLPAEPPFDPDALALVDELADPPAAWRDALHELKVPVLLIAGGPGSPMDQDMLAEMAAMIPDCTLVTIDGGHHVHSAAPAEFAAAVTAFLSAG